MFFFAKTKRIRINIRLLTGQPNKFLFSNKKTWPKLRTASLGPKLGPKDVPKIFIASEMLWNPG